MHNQWWIAGNKYQDEKKFNNEDEVAATATTKDKDNGEKKQYVNPDKDKKCNHCKKKGHVESKCWKKNPELIPNKVKAARKKQAEKKAEKTSTAATAVEHEMVLTVLDMQKEGNKFSCFDMNDAFNVVLIDKDIVYLENIFDKSEKKSDDKESDDEETDDKKGCHEESDAKDRDSNDDKPLVTVSESNEDAYNLDLSLSAVANVIADANFTTGAHILESQDIWIAGTGATSHVTKHTEGGMKHRQTSVQTRGFAGETIQPDCEMDIPVTYSDKNGIETSNIVLGDVQTNKKIH
jgi:hypothetical protein